MFEAHPDLVRSCRRNINQTNLAPRARIFHGLLGKREGSDYLYVSPKTYLTASRFGDSKSKKIRVNYIDLSLLLDGRNIDVLKIDIEGSEYDLISHYTDILKRVKLLFIELHGPDFSRKEELNQSLAACGLKQVSPTSHWCNQELVIYSKDA
jgi:FkbM family methyltransferase